MEGDPDEGAMAGGGPGHGHGAEAEDGQALSRRRTQAKERTGTHALKGVLHVSAPILAWTKTWLQGEFLHELISKCSRIRLHVVIARGSFVLEVSLCRPCDVCVD
jgi:hypothetical protein